jgi:hypothetical protein
MAEVLEEINGLPGAACLSVSDATMATIFGLVGSALLSRVEFPLRLVGIDSTGLCARLVMADPEAYPVTTYLYDPLGYLSPRQWMLPCSISVSDAKGSRVEVKIDGDIRTGKIRLIQDSDAQLVN